MIVQSLLLAAASLPVLSVATSKAVPIEAEVLKDLPPKPFPPSPPPPPPPAPPPPAPNRLLPNLSVLPVNNPSFWIQSYDYPPAALRAEMTGRTDFRLEVTRWGTISDCIITQSSGYALLDEETCRLIGRRARFYPATGPDAKPISGAYSSRIHWTLPDEKPAPSAELALSPAPIARAPEQIPLMFQKPGSTEVAFTVSKEGKVKDCTVDITGRILRDMQTICASFGKRPDATFAPFLDDVGKPIERRIKMKMSIELDPPPVEAK